MRYEENSLFFKDRYKAEIEKILSLEEMYKSQYKKTTLKDSNFSLGIEKTISDKKEMLFLNFLMLKVIEELYYKNNAGWSSLNLSEGLSLRMTIVDEAIIFRDMIRFKGSYASYPDFWFRKDSLLEDVLHFAEGIMPECDARKKFINNIHSDFAFIEKIKIEEKIEPVVSIVDNQRQKRI